MRPIECASDEIPDEEAFCIPLVCEGGGSPYFGRCLTEAEIAALYSPGASAAPTATPAPAIPAEQAGVGTAGLIAVGAVVGLAVLLAAHYLGGK